MDPCCEISNEQVPVIPLSILSNRLDHTANTFAGIFKKNADFFVRVPGRVNLIGEHIDYCGYGVCPMAIQQDIILAVSKEKEPIVHLHNIDPLYADYKSEINREILIENRSNESPPWYNYFLCGLKGIHEILPIDSKIMGMNVVVYGNIPTRSGLSSSSALVSSAVLASSYIYELNLPKHKLASIAAECERYIGTQGGGMDQAIAFLAKEGCAKHIEFNPLRSTDVNLPSGAVFIIAHSLSELNKAATADFNLRVVECRLAAQIIASVHKEVWSSIKTLGQIHKLLDVKTLDMVHLVEEIFHEEPYTKSEIVQLLSTDVDSIRKYSLTENTKDIDKFKLRQRALHVFQEAQRVEEFYGICLHGSGEGDLHALGKLMTDSHTSLRNLYECSHPHLDRLVELSKDITFGCRLTGAGWGGCVVALVRPQNVQTFIEHLKKEFYEPNKVSNIESVILPSTPGEGACIFIKK